MTIESVNVSESAERGDDVTDRQNRAAVRRELLDRLTRRGPECLSQLAVELVVSNRLIESVLQELEREGRVARRAHRFEGCAYEPGEERWGIAESIRR